MKEIELNLQLIPYEHVSAMKKKTL